MAHAPSFQPPLKRANIAVDAIVFEAKTMQDFAGRGPRARNRRGGSSPFLHVGRKRSRMASISSIRFRIGHRVLQRFPGS